MFSKIGYTELLKTVFQSIPPLKESREKCLSKIFEDLTDSDGEKTSLIDTNNTTTRLTFFNS